MELCLDSCEQGWIKPIHTIQFNCNSIFHKNLHHKCTNSLQLCHTEMNSAVVPHRNKTVFIFHSFACVSVYNYCVFVHACVHVRMHACRWACMRVRVCVHVSVCMCACVCLSESMHACVGAFVLCHAFVYRVTSLIGITLCFSEINK